MKKIFILAALVALVGSACDGKKGDKNATCEAPKLDGTVQQISSGCTKGSDIEHIRVEGLTLERGQYARFYYNSTDNSGKDGVIVIIRYDGTITVVNNGDATSVTPGKLKGSSADKPVTNKTACFDFHNDGGNLHFIAWEDKNCDQNYTGTPGSSTVIDDTSGGPFKANAKKMYYKIDRGAKATSVVAKGAIFKE